MATGKRKIASEQPFEKKSKIMWPQYWHEIDQQTQLGHEAHLLGLIESYLSLAEIWFLRRLCLQVKNTGQLLGPTFPELVCHKQLFSFGTHTDLRLYFSTTSDFFCRIKDLEIIDKKNYTLGDYSNHLTLVDGDTRETLCHQQFGISPSGYGVQNMGVPKFMMDLHFDKQHTLGRFSLWFSLRGTGGPEKKFTVRSWIEYDYFLKTFGLNTIVPTLNGQIVLAPM